MVRIFHFSGILRDFNFNVFFIFEFSKVINSVKNKNHQFLVTNPNENTHDPQVTHNPISRSHVLVPSSLILSRGRSVAVEIQKSFSVFIQFDQG
jgi:hypothetical protein